MKENIITFDDGTYYYIQEINDDRGHFLEAGDAVNTGLIVAYGIDYDEDDSFDGNLMRLYEAIEEAKEEEKKIERRRKMRTLRDNRDRLVNAYEATKDKTPDDTIDALIEDAGNIQAREIIAQAVIVHSYDGRISRKAKEWAKTRTITTEEEMINAGVYYDSYIHMAHLNQIAEAMMKREGGER